MIKKFNEYSLTEELENNRGLNRLVDFYNKMKKIVNYDEDEYEQGDEPSRSDLMDEVGDLMNEYELTTDDLQSIVREYPNDTDVEWYVKPQLDYELEQAGKTNELLNVLKTYGITNVDEFYRSLNNIGYKISLK